MKPSAADPITTARQSEASDPRRSAWVSANAGSGKTYVLARRVERLLLAGADPARMLCLTFTKAAAAEMARRVFTDLARWVRQSPADLDAELTALEGRPPSDALRLRARRLFARALETPGGLKIQTIHAFCESLLHQFPFEANVPGHFQVLEENAANLLIAEARRSILAEASSDLAVPLGQALATVVLAASDVSHTGAIAELVENRDGLERWIDRAGSLANALAELGRSLGLGTADTTESVRSRILGETGFDRETIVALVDRLRKGLATDTKAAERLAPYLTAPDDAARLAAYQNFFTKSDGGIRKASALVTKRIKDDWPGLEEALSAECARLETLFERIAVAECFGVSAAIIRLAHAVVGTYQRLKTRRGLLDFDDLIAKTIGLFQRTEASSWVHYKIDQGLDHILIDEAQDTSPGQWRVIAALADDFFSGRGAHDETRTLFAVGDEKQSIYSFQGAVPAWFGRVKKDIAAKATGAGQPFSDLELTVSFRSADDIIRAVDAIFASPLAHGGLSAEARAPVHEAARRNDPGMVVIWPMLDTPPPPPDADWAEPLDHLGRNAPEAILARRVAATVADWLRRGETLAATGKPIRPGGILILARKRGPLSESINRALKNAGVPVAGADRLFLAEHIAVKDLLALADVVLQDRDDLSLAAVLKSPLFGLSEEALFALAEGRAAPSLWRALYELRDAEPFATPYRQLATLRARADAVGPFAFFAEILGPRQARKRFAARLGPEAEDVLDEFLAQALAYERLETPSLQGFLAYMRSTAAEIRRETETGRDEVRVMTVHGAKGLEADVVFLVDDGSSPAHAGHDPSFLALTPDPDAAEPAPLVWTEGVRKLPAAVKAFRDRHRERAREEYRRLLYVAVTRARDRLYVCGTNKESGTDAVGGWHALVSAALRPGASETTAIDGSPAFVWRAAERPAVPRADTPIVTDESPAVPDWLHRRSPSIRAARALTPSEALAEIRPGDRPFAGLTARLALPDIGLVRGRLVHRLLEALPEQAPAIRTETAARYLAAAAPSWTEADRVALAAQVLAILDDPGFAAVFAPGSRPEVDIAAELATAGGPRALSGRIDRLAVTSGEVLIVDYKTNRPPPSRVGDVPEGYVLQLALYRHALRRLYPRHEISAALLWTELPALMPIPSAQLDAAERKITATGEPRGTGMPAPPLA